MKDLYKPRRGQSWLVSHGLCLPSLACTLDCERKQCLILRWDLKKPQRREPSVVKSQQRQALGSHVTFECGNCDSAPDWDRSA